MKNIFVIIGVVIGVILLLPLFCIIGYVLELIGILFAIGLIIYGIFGNNSSTR